jgi:hypothetical protein
MEKAIEALLKDSKIFADSVVSECCADNRVREIRMN